jgi:hypothetical protein
MVSHASAGKNIIGTTKPGNNSGDPIFNGSDIEMGINIMANERIDKARLKYNSAFFFSHVVKAA